MNSNTLNAKLIFLTLLASAKKPPYMHGSVKTVLHAFIHNLFTVGQWRARSRVVRMHSQYAVRCNPGRHMRCLSTLMIRRLFSSWKRVAASTGIHTKKRHRQGHGLNKQPALCALGTTSYSHNMFKMAAKE